MDRVAVVGPVGAGKSTFAAALGERTGLPVVHLDRHFWHPGWVETPRDEWRRRQAELFAGDRWIADGNYGRTFDERFSRADTRRRSRRAVSPSPQPTSRPQRAPAGTAANSSSNA